MKINRTFCLDVEVARELKKRSNQSYLVNHLLKQYLFDLDAQNVYPKLNEASTDQIARALFSRADDQTLKAVLEAFISSNRDANL